jgi:hypothetical protein
MKMTSSGIPLYTVRAKSVELTPFSHRSDNNRIYAAKELKQDLKHCKQLRKLYLPTEKLKKKKAPSNEEPVKLIRYAALIHNSVITATSTEQWETVCIVNDAFGTAYRGSFRT